MYKVKLSAPPQGLNLTEEEFAKLDKTIYFGVCKGQSLHHNFPAHDDLPVSLRMAYRYIDYQFLSAKNIHLRRKVRLRMKKAPKKNKMLLDRKTHLTFINVHFMLAFYLPKKDSESGTAVFHYLQDIITTEEYKRLFAIALTDRGIEFSNPEGIEVDYKTGKVLSNVFYCDPQASNQKPKIEHNHTLLRYIVPKGSNLTFLKEEGLLEVLLSHLNSYGHVDGNHPLSSLLHLLWIRSS